MKNLYTLLFGTVLLGVLLAIPGISLAQPLNTTSGPAFNTSAPSGPPLNTTAAGNGSVTLANPLGVGNFCDLVKALLNIVLAIGVPIAVLFLVWSGFRFILARGSQTGLADAKRNFMYVIIGIAVFLGAWTLATIISATVQTLDSSNSVKFCGR